MQTEFDRQSPCEELGMVVYTYYFSTEKAETGKSQDSVASKPSLFRESYTKMRDPLPQKSRVDQS